jgi:formamidopyrimidine-DNA glycosylase
LAKQIKETINGKKIKNVIAAHSPHKLAWYFGDPQKYRELLNGKTISGAVSWGGQVEISAGDAKILFSDGVNLHYFKKGEKVPDKHQLLLEFEEGSFLVGSVQMYGGLSAFSDGQNNNKYYVIARQKPSPLSKKFDCIHFNSLFNIDREKLSLKAFLATEQRIPGLGNGVLQDILFNARMHPKKKVNTLTAADKEKMFDSIKITVADMVNGGGRDTENDLFGNPGSYKTILSKNTADKPCPVCGTLIKKESYMGGSIYYCSECQKV